MLIAGATGAVGIEVVRLLIDDPKVTKVASFGRRGCGLKSAKLEEFSVDFQKIADREPIDADLAICCLGTTMKNAGTKEKFRMVDHDFIVDFARYAQQCGVESFHLISAMGADKNSRIFYNQVKGETESDVEALGIKSLFIYRPSLLVSNRSENRMGEKIAISLMRIINPLMIGGLRKYRSIHVKKVAEGIVRRIGQKKEGTFRIPSHQI